MLIVTDSAVDVPDSLVESPMTVRVPGEIWVGDAPFFGTEEQFWAALRKGAHLSTTPPTVSALAAAYARPDLVIGLHVSAQLSATVARAHEAAERAGPGVVVVDTRSFSVGAGLVAAAVHAAARSPAAAASVVDFARSLPDRLHTFALVQDVEILRRSDRAGLLPSSHLARNHPLVVAVRGRVVPLAQPRHRGPAIGELARRMLSTAGVELGGWALGHAAATDVGAVVARIAQVLGRPPHFCTRLDPTVASHLGPDSIVVGSIAGPIRLD